MKIRIYFVLISVIFTLSCTKVSTSPDDSLAAPSNLTLEQIDLESIRLTWQDNSSAEERFRIDRKIGDNEWEEKYQILIKNSTTFIDTNLTMIGEYHYRVRASITQTEHSDFVEANIDFFYDDVYSISSLFSGQIDIELYQSFALNVVLRDSLSNIVQRDYDVWFKLPSCPQGFNINDTLFGTDDSLSIQSQNGQAVVSLNAGSGSGIAALKIYVYNSINEEISITKSNIIVHTSFPISAEFSIGEVNSGVNMGNGLWEVELSALLLDSQGNPVYDGMAVWLSLPDNPEWASIMPAAYIGNENANGDSLSGVAFTTLTYNGSHTNDIISVRIETGLGDSFEDELILPMQFPVIDIDAVPIHIDWTQYNNPEWRDYTEELSPYVEITIVDGQNNLISNQEIIFTSTLGTPVLETQLNMSPTNPSFTPAYSGITDENGYLKRYFRFYKYECLLPIPAPPGTTTGTITAQIFGTNTSNQVTVILRRYYD